MVGFNLSPCDHDWCLFACAPHAKLQGTRMRAGVQDPQTFLAGAPVDLSDLERPAPDQHRREQFLDDSHRKLPLEGREQAAKQLCALAESEMLTVPTPRRQLALMGTMPGTGKTRLLDEAVGILRNGASSSLQPWLKHVVELRISFALGGATFHEEWDNLNSAFAWRMLHAWFGQRDEHLDDFYARCRASLRRVTPSQAVDVICASYRREKGLPDDAKVLVYIAIDELQFAVDCSFSPDPQALLTKCTEAALLLQNRHLPNCRVLTAWAGTVLDDMREVLNKGRGWSAELPCPLLTLDQIEAVVARHPDFAEGQPGGAWRTSAFFRCLLALCGGHPRSLERLLDVVKRRKVPLEKISPSDLLYNLEAELTRKSILGWLPDAALMPIVRAAVLKTRVRHDSKIAGASITWQQAQQRGILSLEGGVPVVPLFSLYLALRDHPQPPPLLSAVRSLLTSGLDNLASNDPVLWPQLEQSVADFLVVRANASAAAASGGKGDEGTALTWLLEGASVPRGFAALSLRLPVSTENFEDESAFVLRAKTNDSQEGYDVLAKWPLASGPGDVLLAVQCRQRQANTAPADLQAIDSRIHRALIEEKRTSPTTRVVKMVVSVSKVSRTDKFVVVDSSNMHSFFSPFSTVFDFHHRWINIAPYEALRAMFPKTNKWKGISRTIVEERKRRPFASVVDVEERVPGLAPLPAWKLVRTSVRF